MTLIYSTKYLDFKSTKSITNSPWFYVKRTNDKPDCDSAVVITTLVKNDKNYDFLFLKTQRPPVVAENKAKFCLESPAGLIADNDKNELMLDCAKKELLEETGLIAENLFVELTNSSTSAGLSSETLSYVTAIVNDDKIVSKPVNDNGIIIERFCVNTDEIYGFLNNLDKKIWSVSSATICGVFYALNRVNTLTQAEL